MSTWTITFYVGAVLFLAVMGIEPLQRMFHAARRFSVVCPRMNLPATVWARPRRPGTGQSFRLEGCSRLDPQQTCNKSCIPGLS